MCVPNLKMEWMEFKDITSDICEDASLTKHNKFEGHGGTKGNVIGINPLESKNVCTFFCGHECLF